MIAILILCLSGLIAIITFLKSKEKISDKSFISENADLLKYFDLKFQGVSDTILQKNLMTAAVTLEDRKYIISKERKIMSPLHKNRILGHSVWNQLMKSEADLEIEEKEIEGDAEEIKPNWAESVIKEGKQAYWKNKSLDKKPKNEKKKVEDGLFTKKREVLTKELLRNLKAGNISIKY